MFKNAHLIVCKPCAKLRLRKLRALKRLTPPPARALSTKLKQQSSFRILSDNRSAGHNFHLLDKYEAGIALSGTEVKAAKAGKVQLKEAYADIVSGEAWLVNAHIAEYTHGNRYNHEPVRKRKLLLHRAEIDKLNSIVKEKGLTLVPTKLYLKNGKIKCEVAVGKGKKLHDKRESERAKEMNDEARRAMTRHNAG